MRPVTDDEVIDDSDRTRFVLARDGEEAELVYRRHGDRLVLVHTGVPDALEGQGVGGTLVAAAVERAAADGLTVVPECSFAAGWLERHPEEAARVTVHAPE